MRLLRIVQGLTLGIIAIAFLKEVSGSSTISETQKWVAIVVTMGIISIVLEYFTNKGKVKIFGKTFKVIDKAEVKTCKVIHMNNKRRGA